MSSMLSHLATTFNALGRSGAWDDDSRKGNPAQCLDVQLYKRGYGRKLRARGYAETSAIPWAEDDVRAVIDQLVGEAEEQRQAAAELLPSGGLYEALRCSVRALSLERDATAASYLWEGLQRGKEAGALACPNFADEYGQEILGRLSFMLACASPKVTVSRRLGPSWYCPFSHDSMQMHADACRWHLCLPGCSCLHACHTGWPAICGFAPHWFACTCLLAPFHPAAMHT